MIPNEDEVRGQIDKAAGTVKEHIGRATNDPILESEGADQRSAGEVEHGIGKARRKVGEVIKDIGDKLGS
ncbi:MAG: CsbD family protein [Acidobacteria bacterium]|nr:CsbD family protein [Acidobacteriota bacterium]